MSNVVFQALILILVVRARSHGATPADIGLMFGLYSSSGMVGALIAPRLYRRLNPKAVAIVTTWIGVALLPLFLLTSNALELGAIDTSCSSSDRSGTS
ncbi:hypothetical protein [Catenulispora sp. GP43]|uniref:hypothetical protein n=1 Tax=Catenulispora sp. GP43 TaxID=3156263 RepID=UPI003515C37A